MCSRGKPLSTSLIVNRQKTLTVLNLNEQSPVACHTLNDLISALSEEERTTYHAILQSCSLPASEYKNHASWSNDCYTRNCIAENDQFELVLLCWEPGQFTPIHDHGGEECWVKVIEGEFEETIYQPNNSGEFKQTSSTIAVEGDITYMIDFMGYHRLKNVSKKRGLSLHLYAKPIKTCNVYDEDTKQTFSKDLSYDNIIS